MANFKKKNINFDDNFYLGGVFTLLNSPCELVIDTYHSNPSTPKKEIYKVCSSKGSIKFAYATSKGLIRLSNSSGMIEEENILGSFLKLKPKDYPSFFQHNGFIFPTKKDEYQSINAECIHELIIRLKTCVELMNEITNPNKSYLRIMENAFYLFSSDEIKVKLDNKTIYSSSKHPLYDYICGNTSERITNERLRYLKDENCDYKIKDSIFEFYTFDSDEYSSIMENSDEFYKRLVYIYVNKANEYSNDEKLIIDTLFHYFHEFLPNSTSETLLDKNLKPGIIALAKLVIKEEIDHNIKGVKPSYNTEKMEPKWEVDNLLTAMYMSLFYLRANNYIYKQCPHCGTYFIVSRTTSKKIYCSDRCRNNANAKVFRKAHQKNEKEPD